MWIQSTPILALGIPAVVSPVGVNTTIITHGENGFICGNTSEWKNVLSNLLQDKNLRHSIGQKGKERVLNNYSVEANKKNYLKLFEK